MIKWFKRNQDMIQPGPNNEQLVDPSILSIEAETSEVPSSVTVLQRFKDRLSKTRQQLGDGVSRLLQGKKVLDAELLEELETTLLSADVGLPVTTSILGQLSERLARKQLADGDAALNVLKEQLQALLRSPAPAFSLHTMNGTPFVVLVVGVNGAGKTTTIGKLAKLYQQQGKKVLLAAGDTFRAAAVEQLQAWGKRNHIPVIAQHTGADSASVIFDAVNAAKSRGVDVVIADTAGRLHTQMNLMNELKKIKRVVQQIDSSAPHETMLVLDASIGQNALNQARQFHEAIDVTGITLTKLDGTAKGGIVFAIAHELGIPFRYLGLGEGIDDLRPFEATYFVDALFNDDYIQPSK